MPNPATRRPCLSSHILVFFSAIWVANGQLWNSYFKYWCNIIWSSLRKEYLKYYLCFGSPAKECGWVLEKLVPGTQIPPELSGCSGYFSLCNCFISLSLSLSFSVSFHSVIDFTQVFCLHVCKHEQLPTSSFYKTRLLKELAHSVNFQNSQGRILTVSACVRWPTWTNQMCSQWGLIEVIRNEKRQKW